ncbi:MAG TPA: hypothetical protein VFZ00_25260 [Solirubrobacter sp.]|nr:hypothetical protein [Solirubrobacter sp.]
MDESAVIAAIVVTRLFVPLLIPRYPLSIILALVADAVDNSILGALTTVDLGPDGPYQSFDKALDIYYLAIAYTTTLRNWTSRPAIGVAQFLFYYRLVGVLLFELLDERALLLIFPNTFEFFFIAYEAVRTRFDPARRSARFWVLTAAGIWVLIKLPQEYWIHVAKLDFTETVADHPWFGVACALGLLALAAVLWFVVRPRLPAPDWDWRFAADPRPATDAMPHPGLRELAEKTILVALIAVIFGEILPTVQMSALEVAVGVAAVVVANTAISRWRARTARFGVLLAINLGFVYAGSRLLSDSEDFPVGTGLFFAFLITLLTTLYDRYRRIYELRFES